jgi:hypothetical protein
MTPSQAEVENMMRDPQFRAQMEAYTQSPEFAGTMKMAQDQIKDTNYPAKMAELQAKLGGLMQ